MRGHRQPVSEWTVPVEDLVGRDRQLVVGVDDAQRRWHLRTPPGEVAAGDARQLRALIVQLTQVLHRIA